VETADISDPSSSRGVAACAVASYPRPEGCGVHAKVSASTIFIPEIRRQNAEMVNAEIVGFQSSVLRISAFLLRSVPVILKNN
jgi:hypothetical protein